MLLNDSRQKSLALLQLTAAVFILIAPSLLGFLSVSAEVYLCLSVALALLTARIKTEERVYFSFSHIVSVILLAYGILSSLWANNREGQLIYLYALLVSASFASLSGEYFAENADGQLSRRMMNMLSLSGTFCAIVNIIYWLIYIVPVAGTQALGKGLETADFTAIFVGICIIVSLKLIKGSAKIRKASLIAGIVMMAFVFIMAKSLAGWAFILAVSFVIYIDSKEKFKKSFTVTSLFCAFAFMIVTVLLLMASDRGDAFRDVFAYGIKNVFGHGGGFWSAREIFSSVEYSKTLGAGMLAYLFASAGIFGLLCCVLIVARNIMLAIKVKNKESVIALLLTVAVMLLPFGENLTVILLWLGFNGYVEHIAGFGVKMPVKKEKLEKILYTLYVIMVISVTLLFLSLIKMSADRAYAKKNYDEAADYYKTVATINITDGESCRLAAISMRKGGRTENNCDEAIRIIDRAIKRDSDNLENLREKALIYKSGGEFELSAQQYREALGRARIKDKYNLELAKVLYKVVEKYPKGSSETKRAYEEIVSIAAATEDLDSRKEINDIADKALGYTKGELSGEG